MNNKQRVGRSAPCVNSSGVDYKEHRMKTVYVRPSTAEKGNKGKPRSMQSLGYYCFKCQQFWTNEQVDRIVEELVKKREEYLQHVTGVTWSRSKMT